MSLRIKVILASVREGRFGAHVAPWFMEHANAVEGVTFELVDLKEYQLPIFAEKVSPAYVPGDYGKPEVDRWAKVIAEADGFVMITPEYNHGYPSSLKNNIDYLAKEWNKKAIGFVGYGSTGGARVIQQLRSVSTELQMAPIRASVHIMNPWFMTEADGSLKPGALAPYDASATAMIEQLVWWATALKNAREQK